MKWQWCWRCQQDMPMLDEEEFARVTGLFRDGFGAPRRPLKERFASISREYARLTGYPDCHPNAVMHHRLSLFGPPCAACSKPLRTPPRFVLRDLWGLAREVRGPLNRSPRGQR